jgi:hypothetical protein
MLAFSPVLQNLAEHWLTGIWPRYSLSLLPLLLWCVRCDRGGRPLRWQGLALVCAGLAVELLAARAAVLPVARPALAVAVIGVILMRGLASVRTALLALFVLPMPRLFVELGGLTAATHLFETGGALLSGVGLNLVVEEGLAVSGGKQLPIDAAHGGLLLLAQMMGLAWYRALRRGLDWRGTASSLALFAVQAVPIQFTAILLALLALGAGAPVLAGAVLNYGSWLVPLLVTVYLTECPNRRRD